MPEQGLTKGDILEILEVRDTALLKQIDETLERSIDSTMTKLENAMLKRDEKTLGRINENERTLDAHKSKQEQLFGRTDKIFSFIDSFRDNFTPKLTALEVDFKTHEDEVAKKAIEDAAKEIKAEEEKKLMEARMAKLERLVNYGYGIGAFIGAAVGLYSQLK